MRLAGAVVALIPLAAFAEDQYPSELAHRPLTLPRASFEFEAGGGVSFLTGPAPSSLGGTLDLGFRWGVTDYFQLTAPLLGTFVPVSTERAQFGIRAGLSAFGLGYSPLAGLVFFPSFDLGLAGRFRPAPSVDLRGRADLIQGFNSLTSLWYTEIESVVLAEWDFAEHFSATFGAHLRAYRNAYLFEVGGFETPLVTWRPKRWLDVFAVFGAGRLSTVYPNALGYEFGLGGRVRW